MQDSPGLGLRMDHVYAGMGVGSVYLGFVALRRIAAHCGGAAPEALADVAREASALAQTLGDLQEPPGYHPAHDQVVAIALRPLIEQVFRSQQRMVGAPDAKLRLLLEGDHAEWFPARLRRILDNLISNSLRYRDPEKTEMWVEVVMRPTPEGYEFRVSDNGRGLPQDRGEILDLLNRASPTRGAGLGVGLAVVRLLVERSGGSLTGGSGEGQGTTFILFLPRYDLTDFLV